MTTTPYNPYEDPDWDGNQDTPDDAEDQDEDD